MLSIWLPSNRILMLPKFDEFSVLAFPHLIFTGASYLTGLKGGGLLILKIRFSTMLIFKAQKLYLLLIQ